MATTASLAALLKTLLKHEEPCVDRVSVIYAEQAIPRTRLLREPCLIFVAQGRKTGYLGERRIVYKPGRYLVQTLPLSFECEARATTGDPLIALCVTIDLSLLAELVHQMPTAAEQSASLPMAPVVMTTSMREAVMRLARCLNEPVDSRIMGAHRVREVIFEALKGSQGAALRALVEHGGDYSKIIRILSYLHRQLEQSLTVEGLARRAHLSVSGFHKHFKRVTGCSPVQYLKRLRLTRARMLLFNDRFNVSQTAHAVGYRSISQFSRDYKDRFGVNPSADVGVPR